MKYAFLIAVALPLLAACQAPPRPHVDRSRVVADLIGVTTPICASDMAADQEAKRLLKTLNKSAREICRCSYERFFEGMTDVEFDRFFDDIQEHGGDVAELQPWKKRFLAATLSCMAPHEQQAAFSAARITSR
jgi:hypothetical protein